MWTAVRRAQIFRRPSEHFLHLAIPQHFFLRLRLGLSTLRQVVVVLGYWNLVLPVVYSADRTAGLGGNLGVICPDDESLPNLGDMLEGGIDEDSAPPFIKIGLEGCWGCEECLLMWSWDVCVGCNRGIVPIPSELGREVW